MKKLFLIIGTLLLLSTSCSKPENGKDGINGTNGTNGNANVQQYSFGSRTVAANYFASYIVPNFTQQQLDTSVIICFYEASINPNVWYAVPGIGYQSQYITRSIFSISGTDLKCNVELRSFSGAYYPNSETLNRFRIIIVPSSSNVVLARERSHPDYNKMSYEEACKYFKISN